MENVQFTEFLQCWREGEISIENEKVPPSIWYAHDVRPGPEIREPLSKFLMGDLLTPFHGKTELNNFLEANQSPDIIMSE